MTNPQPADREQPTTTVDIARRSSGERPAHVEVPAYETGIPGLVVVDHDDVPDRVLNLGKLFTVVHALTGTKVGGVWSTLANAVTAAVAVHTALHIDWTIDVDPSLQNAVNMQFNKVHEDLQDWPLGRPQKLRTPLRRAGDNHMADAAVVCTIRGVRHILLGERDDGGGWAIPGGGVEDGETTEAAARRELLEETGFAAAGVHAFHLTRSLPVDDPRNTAERRAVTDLFLFLLDDDYFVPPPVRAGDDLRSVEWIPFRYAGDADRPIAVRGSFLFRPHLQLLTITLRELETLAAIDAYFEACVRDAWLGVDADEVEHQKRQYRKACRANETATREVLAWAARPGGLAALAQG